MHGQGGWCEAQLHQPGESAEAMGPAKTCEVVHPPLVGLVVAPIDAGGEQRREGLAASEEDVPPALVLLRVTVEVRGRKRLERRHAVEFSAHVVVQGHSRSRARERSLRVGCLLYTSDAADD